MKKKNSLLFFLSVIAINGSFGASADHLIFKRISTIPNEAEAISIYNPTQYAIPLNNLHDINNPNKGSYFLTDGYVSDDSNQHYTNIAFINNGYKMYNEQNVINDPYCGSLGDFIFSNTPDSLNNIFLIDENDSPQNMSYFNKTNLDCQGTVVDACGLCDGPGILEGECDCFGNVFDCSGVCGGSDEDTDGDGICESIDNCDGEYDICGVCDGDGSSCIDCNDETNGYAYLDDCVVCVGGATGLSPCLLDCNNDSGGSAFFDHCGNCVWGDTGEDPCQKDCFGVWGGSAVIDECGICGGSGSALGYDCQNDCIIGVDACGVCGGNITDPYECNYGMDENCPLPPNSIYLDHNNEIWINTDLTLFKDLNFKVSGSIIINSDLIDAFTFEKEFWSKNYNDFFIQFPENSTIMPGETQIISIHMDSIFYDYYGYAPDYNIHELTTKETESFLGENNTIDYLEDSGNNGESLILFYWDGESNVVKDVDYFLWGSTAFAIDKTNIPNYYSDQPSDFQSFLDNTINHFSYNRTVGSNNYCCNESGETDNGGNGITGHNEMSENFEESWFIELNPEKTLGCMDDSECNYDIGGVIDESLCLEITDPEDSPWNTNTNYCTIEEDACLSIEPSIWNTYTKPIWSQYNGNYEYTEPVWNSSTNKCEVQRLCALNYASSADVDYSEIFDTIDYTTNDRCIYNYGCTDPSFFNFDIEATKDYSSCVDANPVVNEFEGLVSINDVNNDEYPVGTEVLVSGKIIESRLIDDTFWILTIRDEDNYQVDITGSGWNIATSKLNYLINPYNYTEFVVSVLGVIDEYQGSAQIQIDQERKIDDYIRYHKHGEFHEDFNNQIISAKIIPAPYVIIPSEGERLDFLYSFPTNSRVIIRVISLDGRVITSLMDNFYIDGGTVERKEEMSDWDGRDHLGQIVPPGTYLFHIEASNFTTGKTYEHVAPVVVGINHK